MKKIIASAVGLALVGGVAVTTASAVESQFGGYWRTRFTYDDNMLGTDAKGAKAAIPAYVDDNGFAIPAQAAVAGKAAANDSGSNYITDTRTRLYYTAKFNDDFKFVNKFEFDAKWGGPAAGYGDIGADGKDFEIKNSYADFTLGNVNTKVGVQGTVISRGFIFDDDFSGVIVTPTLGNVKVPFLYAVAVDDEARSATSSVSANAGLEVPVIDADGDFVLDADGNVVLKPVGVVTATPTDGGDVNMFALMPTFMISDTFNLTPHVTYVEGTSDIDTELYWIGVDLDMKFDTVSAWGTFIYNGGESGGTDIEAFLGAVGADAGVVHGQVFYATGDEDINDDDYDGFVGAPGQSYYWSEIMGLGVFDNNASNGSPGGQVTNIMAANLGVSLKPADKMTFDFDVWYAALAEENVNGDDALGLEFDAKLTYALMDNLSADFIFAYLVADDATGDEDVMEGGVRLSLKF